MAMSSSSMELRFAMVRYQPNRVNSGMCLQYVSWSWLGAGVFLTARATLLMAQQQQRACSEPPSSPYLHIHIFYIYIIGRYLGGMYHSMGHRYHTCVKIDRYQSPNFCPWPNTTYLSSLLTLTCTSKP